MTRSRSVAVAWTALSGILILTCSAAMPAFAHSARQSTASIKPLDNGGYAIQGDSYAASVDAHGMLSEFKVRGQNLLAGPFVYADGDPSKPNTIDWKIMAARLPRP